MKNVTLLFLRREGHILLAMKKRGFGKGRWNGVGGKVDKGESIEAAAVRECEEEIGVTPEGLQLVGDITFHMTHDPAFGHHAYVFVATSWQGKPQETEETQPKWFSLEDIPYHEMWADDPLWLPLVLAGKKFKADITTDEHDQVASADIKDIP